MADLGGRRVAAFDVDGTLTLHDCVGPFLRRVAGRRRLVTAVPLALAAGRVQRDAVKAHLIARTLTGEPRSVLDEHGRALADDVVATGLRPAVAARLRWHQRAGDAVVFVSASLRPYLEPMAGLLAVDGVVCTELAFDADGRATGGLDGPNCRGDEKLRRLRDWLGADDRLVAAYGDSRGDRAMLAAAEEGWWVRSAGMHRHEP